MSHSRMLSFVSTMNLSNFLALNFLKYVIKFAAILEKLELLFSCSSMVKELCISRTIGILVLMMNGIKKALKPLSQTTITSGFVLFKCSDIDFR